MDPSDCHENPPLDRDEIEPSPGFQTTNEKCTDPVIEDGVLDQSDQTTIKIAVEMLFDPRTTQRYRILVLSAQDSRAVALI